jgi:mono/diheme cytochrome c family protein
VQREGQAEWAATKWQGMNAEELARGRALYATKCSGCHNLHLPAEYTTEEWKKFVDEMAEDANVSASEEVLISRYLITLSKDGAAAAP